MAWHFGEQHGDRPSANGEGVTMGVPDTDPCGASTAQSEDDDGDGAVMDA